MLDDNVGFTITMYPVAVNITLRDVAVNIT